MNDEAAKEFANAFSKFVNGSRHQAKTAAEMCSRDHNTLQQGMMRFCMMYVQEMANKERGVDLRNEASHKLAKQIVESVPDLHMLPLI